MLWSTLVCVEHGGMCGARWYVWSTVVCVEHGSMCRALWCGLAHVVPSAQLEGLTQIYVQKKQRKLVWRWITQEPCKGLCFHPFSRHSHIPPLSRPILDPKKNTKLSAKVWRQQLFAGARCMRWSTLLCVEHGGLWGTLVCVGHGGMCGATWSTVVCVVCDGMCAARWYVCSTVVCAARWYQLTVFM